MLLLLLPMCALRRSADVEVATQRQRGHAPSAQNVSASTPASITSLLRHMFSSSERSPATVWHACSTAAPAALHCAELPPGHDDLCGGGRRNRRRRRHACSIPSEMAKMLPGPGGVGVVGGDGGGVPNVVAAAAGAALVVAVSRLAPANAQTHGALLGTSPRASPSRQTCVFELSPGQWKWLHAHAPFRLSSGRGGSSDNPASVAPLRSPPPPGRSRDPQSAVLPLQSAAPPAQDDVPLAHPLQGVAGAGGWRVRPCACAWDSRAARRACRAA